MENENKEILEEIYKALNNLEETKMLLKSIENTLNYMEYILETTKEKRYENICGLFEYEGDVVDKDYLLYDLNDKLEECSNIIGSIFEELPILTITRKRVLRSKNENRI